MKKDHHKNIRLSDAPKSTKVLEGEIPKEILEKVYNKVYNDAKNRVEVPGFRAGKAPEALVKKHLNEAVILDHAAEEVLKEEYPLLIESFNIFPVDHPKIEITKLAMGNPLAFRIHVPVMPKIETPDYSKIAKKTNSDTKEIIEVADKEIDEAIFNIRNIFARRNQIHDGHKHEHSHEHDHNHDHANDHSHKHEKDDKEELKLPELDDEFVKKVGDFKNVEDFKEKVKSSLLNEKVIRAKEKKRVSIIENIVKDFDIDLPQVMIDGELDRMMFELDQSITKGGLSRKEYFEQINKTEDDIRKEWEPEAIKRVKMEIALVEIAKKENLKPEADLVKKEVDYILEHHKDADKKRVDSYVEHMLTNEKVFEYLENIK